ncbi:hypothetical protein H5410_050943 [Solanum commersonii]|uniref:Uncharacterized protein n=1 Tax=Solanum commersonii TaxID=4109 RepID=A0A9J5WZ30_SOLCO|nr:hypothetical protein H5410_050943 [Solanum commersonii]
MWKFHQKLKRLSNTLSSWSRKELGDIFGKVREYEEKIRMAEEELIQDQKETNRTALHEQNAEYIKFLKLEDSILKQKTQLQWFKEGDANTKYFHSLIRGRRGRLFIHKLIRDDGEWLQGEDNIAMAACDHFKNLFMGDSKFINEGALECIPRMVNREQNESLTALPTLAELKEVVFSMNPNSAAGPDGMNGTRGRIKRITGFRQKEGPITYLGCPLFVGRPRIIYFSDLINKFLCRIIGWQTRLLSYGGRAILIKHVLQSLPIHLLSAVTPPSTVLK